MPTRDFNYGPSSEDDPPTNDLVINFVGKPIKLKNKSSGTRRWLFHIGYVDADDAWAAIFYFHPGKRFWKWAWSPKNRERLDRAQLLHRESLPLPEGGRLTSEYFMSHIPDAQIAEAIAASIVEGER